MNRDPGGISQPADGHLRRSRARRDRAKIEYLAFRIRAGLQGQLAACDCAFPVEKAETETGHPLDCPGHYLALQQRDIALKNNEPLPTIVMDAQEAGGVK